MQAPNRTETQTTFYILHSTATRQPIIYFPEPVRTDHRSETEFFRESWINKLRSNSVKEEWLLLITFSLFSRSTILILSGSWLAIRGSNSGRGKKDFLLHNLHIGSGAQPASYSIGTGVLSLGEIGRVLS